MSTRASRPKPIVLCPVRARQATGDDSRPGIPTSIPPGLYESVHHCGTAGVPSGTGPIPPLAYFCIRTLLDYADQVHCLGSHRIRCQPEVLRALSPPTFGDLDATTRCLCKLDPRLWSIIVQVYSGLPKGLQNYFLPLGDRHLPLLQAIPSTPSFALVTVVNLSGHVSDETSHALKSLHALCALDISRTSVSHLGIRHFAPMTTAKPSDPRHGTRGLRILRLCDCPKITDQVIGATSAFPLLAVLDLRGTSCTQGLKSSVFRPSTKSQRGLFQCSLQEALQRLRDSDFHNVLLPHPDPFVIHISTEFHPRWPQRPKTASNTFTFLPEKNRAAPFSMHQRYHHQQDPFIANAERDLRKWISSMLGNAGNETRISEIADFVMQHWEYDPGGPESDWGYDSDFPFSPEEEDPIDSWDEGSSTKSCLYFCGYEVNEDLGDMVLEMVEDAQEEHESAVRFYGLDPRAQKTAVCHCETLRCTTTPPAETMPTDRYLMLIRDPPRWDSVYGPNAPPARRVRLTTKPSLSDSSSHCYRSSVQAKKSTQEVLDMIIQRKSLPTTSTSLSHNSTPTVGRNPFRKDPNSDSARGGLKNLHRGLRDSTRDGSLGSVPYGPTPKRMKSISQIPVPPQPTSRSATLYSQRTKRGGGPGMAPKEHGKLKQTTLLGVFGKRT